MSVERIIQLIDNQLDYWREMHGFSDFVIHIDKHSLQFLINSVQYLDLKGYDFIIVEKRGVKVMPKIDVTLYESFRLLKAEYV